MLFMIFLILRVYENIINEHNHKLVQLWHENCIYQIHKYAGAFVKPKDITRYSYNPYLVEKRFLVYLVV
jgi:hypothetical protein